MQVGYRICIVGAMATLLAAALGFAGGQERSTRAEASIPPPTSSTKLTRVRSGLQVLYHFQDTNSPLVRDRAGVGKPIDLRIHDLKAVHRSKGKLAVRSPTHIRSDKPATRLNQAIRRSGEFTVEAWIEPAKRDQRGPARILSLSKNANERNLTLGQDKDRYDIRLRTDRTNRNGIPSVASKRKSLKTSLTHIVYTRERTGWTRIYLNGVLATETRRPGSLANWQDAFHLVLANELSGDRPWLGTFHLVAIYQRALFRGEVERNFRAGPNAPSAGLAVQASTFFDAKVAPLFAKHCLECHDSITKKGRLDLSRKDAAFAGGRSGDAIVPGKLAESLVWETVANDEMPKNRDSLSEQEKALLRDWIQAGADWSSQVIDPTAFTHHAQATEVWLQRLTVTEYIATVKAAVGVDIAAEARKRLPKDLRADGFSNTAYNLNVDLKHIEAYAKLAELIVDRMDVAAFVARFSEDGKPTEKELRPLIHHMGRWLLRGPLNERETEAFLAVVEDVRRQGGVFNEAMRYVLEAMLQSPRFIYRIERQRGDGTPWPVHGYELASRLSYILWGAPPDEELLRAAEAGELYEPSQIESQVQRMLKDPRAIERSTQFVREWLNLDRLAYLAPNLERFPNWAPHLAVDMHQETLTFFREIVWKQQRPLSDLFNAQVSYLTPRLAKHYGLKPQGNGFGRYDLSKIPSRGGLLTHGSILTVGGDDASMVTRGLFVLHDLLRGTVKDPPPCVDTTPVPTKAGRTQRGIAEVRIADVSCGGCHVKFEPLAFGLEKFDGLGTYHERDEHGNKLRDDGEILFPGAAKPVPYRNAAELMELLAHSERVRECLTWKLAQFALGRPLVAEDVPVLKQVHRAAWNKGGTYADLIRELVTSDLVRMTRTERN